jgi:hypothetical protein
MTRSTVSRWAGFWCRAIPSTPDACFGNTTHILGGYTVRDMLSGILVPIFPLVSLETGGNSSR